MALFEISNLGSNIVPPAELDVKAIGRVP